MGNVYKPCKDKTVMTAVLTVKSGMDPHMIRGLVWIGGLDGLDWSGWTLALSFHVDFGWYFT